MEKRLFVSVYVILCITIVLSAFAFGIREGKYRQMQLDAWHQCVAHSDYTDMTLEECDAKFGMEDTK